MRKDCIGGCGEGYCSQSCEDIAFSHGHSFLCFPPPSSSSSIDNNNNNNNGNDIDKDNNNIEVNNNNDDDNNINNIDNNNKGDNKDDNDNNDNNNKEEEEEKEKGRKAWEGLKEHCREIENHLPIVYAKMIAHSFHLSSSSSIPLPLFVLSSPPYLLIFFYLLKLFNLIYIF